LEVARLEAVYTARTDDFDRKTSRVDSRLKQTATQARTTERAVNRSLGSGIGEAFRGLGTSVSAIGGPLGAFQSRLSSLAPIAGGLTSATGGLGIAVGALGAIMVGATAAVVNFTISTARSIDQLGDMAEKVNFSVRTISGLQTAIEASGGSLEGFTNALGIFDKNIEKAAQGDERLSRLFKALKIDATDNEAAFRGVAKVLIDLGGTSQQTALAMELFGRSGKDVLGILKETGGNVDGFISKMEALGLVISDDAVRASDALDRELVQLRAQFRALSRDLAMDLIPSIRDTAKEMSASMGKNRDEVRSTIGSVFDLIKAIAKLNDFIMSINPIILSVKMIHSIINDKAAGGTGPGGSGANLIPIVPGSVYAPGSGAARGIPLPPDMSAEFAIAGGPGQHSMGAGPGGTPASNTLADRVRDLLKRGGAGGRKGKEQQDILQGLKASLIELNAEFRKHDVALLGSANSTALLAEKEKILTNLMSGLKVETRLVISDLTDIDQAIDKAIGSLPKKSQAAARELVNLSLAQFKQNQATRIGGELSQKAEDLLRGWRIEIDNSRSGADRYTQAIDDLEQAYAKYGLTLNKGTKAEMLQVAAIARSIEKTKELTRARILGERPRRFHNNAPGDVLDLGGGSFFMEGGTGFDRDRFATVGETVFREREQMRRQQMQEVAQDLGSIFGDAFDSIRDGWENLWRDMADIAQNISRQFISELFTGMFSRAFNVPFQSQSGGLVGGVINRIFGGGSGAIDLGGGSTVTPGGTGLTRPRIAGARAMGGPVDAGKTYLVGERGPELFRPKLAGWIDPGDQARRGGGGESMRFYFVDDERAAFERGATRREIAKVSKQMRKVGKLIPGF
jgi:hypothetical protein